jgi:exonuclease I
LESSASIHRQQQRTPSSAKKRAMQEADRETKKLKADISDVVVMISSIYKERENTKRTKENMPQREVFTNSKDVLAEIKTLSDALNDKVTFDSMPVTTREEYLQALNEKRNRLTTKMLELVRAEAAGN